MARRRSRRRSFGRGVKLGGHGQELLLGLASIGIYWIMQQTCCQKLTPAVMSQYPGEQQRTYFPDQQGQRRQSGHGSPRSPGSPGSAPPRGGDYWTWLQRGGGLNPQNRSPFPGVTSPVPGAGQAPWQTESPAIRSLTKAS
jgi:hypothetical protein